MRTTLIIATLAVLTASVQSQMRPNFAGGTWSFVGPKRVIPDEPGSMGPSYISGCVLAVAYDPVVPTTIYAGAALGGLWKSTDSGTTWKSISDDWPTQKVSSIAIAPKNRNVIYVGTGDWIAGSGGSRPQGENPQQPGLNVGLMKSVDGGQTWTNIVGPFLNMPIAKLLVDPDDSNQVTALTCDTQNYNTINQPGGAYQSTDGGATWSPLSLTSPALWTDIAVSAPDTQGHRRYWIAGQTPGRNMQSPNSLLLFTSTDRGQTWTQITLPSDYPTGYWTAESSVACSKTDPHTIYWLGHNEGSNSVGGMWKSNDDAKTWTRLLWGDGNTQGVDILSDIFADGIYLRTVPTSNGKDGLYIGADTVNYSADSGVSWSNIGGYFTSGARLCIGQHCFAQNPRDPTEVLLGSNGGVYKYSSKTDSMASLNEGLYVADSTSLDVYPNDPSYVVAGGMESLSPVSWGDLEHWVDIGEGGRRWSPAIFVPAMNLTLVGNGYVGGILKYVNGNNTSVSSYSFHTTGVLTDDQKSLLTEVPGFSLGLGDLTTGNSTAFTLAAGMGTTGFNGWENGAAVCPSNPAQIYAGSGSVSFNILLSAIQMSTDYGKTWQVIGGNFPSSVLPISHDFTSVEPMQTNADDVIVVFQQILPTPTSDHTIYRCVNVKSASPQWVDVTGPNPGSLRNTLISAVARDPNKPDTWYVATETGVLQTTDGGASYQDLNVFGLPRAIVTGLKVFPKLGMLYASTLGRGIWKLPIPSAATASISGFTVQTPILGGGNGTGTVTLGAAAPKTGETIYLSEAVHWAATIPPSVIVPAGKTSATFSFKTNAVPYDANVWLTATEGNAYHYAKTTVLAPRPPVASLVLDSSSVIAGAPVTGTVVLQQSVDSFGGIVGLTSNSVAVKSGSIVMPANTASATFSLPSFGVNADVLVTIKASSGSSFKTATLTVHRATLSLVSVSPSSIFNGNSSTGTIKFTGLTPDIVVGLSSTSTAVHVPASVAMSGVSTATFSVTTATVTTPVSATITATFGGVSKSAKVALNPATFISLGLTNSSVVGGASETGNVTLNGIAPTGGLSIALTSSDPTKATAPAAVLVAAGKGTGSFAIPTAAVDSSEAITITATYQSTVKSKVFTILPASLTTLTLRSTSVIGGAKVVAIVSLNSKAGPSRRVVTLSSSVPAAASVPASVTIPSGATYAEFTVTTFKVSVKTTVTITAKVGTKQVTAIFTVGP